MKRLAPLLLLSLGANLVLAWLLWHASGPQPQTAATVAKPPSRLVTQADVAPTTPPARPQAYTHSPTELRDRLAAAGFPSDVVRAVVRAVIEEPRMARTREFYAEMAKKPWWHGMAQFTADQSRELRQLSKNEREEISRVLGAEGHLFDEQLERYSYLPADKAARLVMLERDYAELRRDPGDQKDLTRSQLEERQALLKAERERDLAALLSPAERAAWEERESPAARNLSTRLEYFDATDAEYRAILGLQKTLDGQMSGRAASDSAANRGRGEAMRAFGESLKATLGPDRYAAYLQAQRPEYRALIDLQRRFDVPAPAIERAARLHAEITAEAARIADDPVKTNVEKQQALTALTDKAQHGVRAALGPEHGDIFIAATRSHWIDVLARGAAYSAQPTGGTSVRNFTGEARRNPAPPAPPPKR